MPQPDVDKLIGHLFRSESGKMVSVLTRLLGFNNFQTAEDIVQDTLLKAMSAWKFQGVPDNPSAWMHTVAKRKAIDVLRQRKLHHMLNQEVARDTSSEWTLSPTVNQYFRNEEIDDSQLRMMFACCHPCIPYDSQVAFTLKTLCGLSVAEIANSFLTSEETITKRLFRAREKIREEKIELEFPDGAELSNRLGAVHHALYLLFNEGYHASRAETFIRTDLCEEAIRLALILAKNPSTDTSESHALLALMCLQAAREDSRLDMHGNIILLKDQDRTKWNRELIRIGLFHLDKSTETDAINAFQIEAAIAACHATAASFETTDWNKIVTLYEELENIKPGPIIKFNKAIATGFAHSPMQAVQLLLAIGEMKEHHLYYTALGDCYERMNEYQNAISAYQQALEMVATSTERSFLEKKISELS